jgi:type IX secretion system PorP/SprF family membrane protein
MKVKLLVMFCVVSLTVFSQQDPQYSQYQFNQMVINPAYAGNRDALSVVLDVRQQWAGFEGAPRTQAFSIHSPIAKKRIGLGLSAYSDQIGPRKNIGVYGNFSYMLPINNKLKLSFGLRGGLINYNIDWTKVSYKDQSEALAVYGVSRTTRFDLDAGLFLKSNTFYCGISATHLNRPVMFSEAIAGASSFNYGYSLNPHLFFIISKGFKMGENLVFNPSLMLKSTNGINSTYMNLNFLIKQKVWVGAFINSANSIGFLTQVYLNEKFRIGYAFDTGIGKVNRQLGPSHEIMLGFDFNTYKSKMLSPRYL